MSHARRGMMIKKLQWRRMGIPNIDPIFKDPFIETYLF
jgi:hypothetical protein